PVPSSQFRVDRELGTRNSEPGTLFELQGVSFAYPGMSEAAVLSGISLALERGEYVAVLGPNGAGKSTLLRLLAGVLTPGAGTIALDGRPLGTWSRRRLARRVAMLPQRLQLAFDARVEDVVALGRIPHSPPLLTLGGPSAADLAAVQAALEATDTVHFRHRLVQQLSGGEQQRVALALALAQEPDVLLLDEPTSHLDPGQAQAMLDLIATIRQERGLTVLAVFHDLNLASLYAERLLVLHRGRLLADGPPAAVLRAPVLDPVFGQALHFLPHPEYGLPQAVPRRRVAPPAAGHLTPPAQAAQAGPDMEGVRLEGVERA
ncbi:MAG TPA: ABC transporter ATP-binding protein, partial [Chloroflexota bacterium]|nr:ABC transporter ATP-binding protein [Chloroflexota bacterium]